MRVRAAKVSFKKAAGLEPLFGHAVVRRLAWVIGEGRVYADLEKTANKHNYRLWVAEVNDSESAGDADSLWVAVREDLIADDGWDAGPEYLTFDATYPGLGIVGLVGDDLFSRRSGVTVESSSNTEHENFVYAETVYLAEPIKN